MGKPICSIDGCANTSHSRGWCNKHYLRWRVHGDPNASVQDRRRNEDACSVDGCDTPSRKRGWCGAHYAQWYTYGEVRPFYYKWAKEKRCVICGATGWAGKRRKVCSPRCQQLLVRHGEGIGRTIPCNRCGQEIDLFETSPKSGRKRRTDTLLCRTCNKSRYLRHGVSVSELYVRDGDACGICEQPVDMTLKYPHLQSPTVDHVMPVSHGGTHDLDNLVIAHLTCNATKQARVGWEPAS